MIDKNWRDCKLFNPYLTIRIRINYSTSDHVEQPRYNEPQVLIEKVQKYVITPQGT